MIDLQTGIFLITKIDWTIKADLDYKEIIKG